MLVDLAVFSLVCIGLVFSGSRMGVVGALSGIAVVGVCAFATHKRRATVLLTQFCHEAALDARRKHSGLRPECTTPWHHGDAPR